MWGCGKGLKGPCGTHYTSLLGEGILLHRWPCSCGRPLAYPVPCPPLGPSPGSGRSTRASGSSHLPLGVDSDTQSSAGPEEAEDGEDVDNDLEDGEAGDSAQIHSCVGQRYGYG